MPKLTRRRMPRHVDADVEEFSGWLIRGGEDMEKAIRKLESMPGREAVQLVLAASTRIESIIGEDELTDLADWLGVYGGDV